MKYVVISILFVLSFTCKIKAQNPSPPAFFEIYTNLLSNTESFSVDNLLLGNSTNLLTGDSVQYKLKTVLSLLDTTNVSTIYLNIQDTLNGATLYNDSILFNNLNTPFEYREGNLLYIETDTLINLKHVYGSVYLKDLNGNISTTIHYSDF